MQNHPSSSSNLSFRLPAFLILFLVLSSFSFVFSQNENEACQEPKKKVVKLIDKARSAEPRVASKLFAEAIEEDEENAMAYYEFALYAYDRALALYDQYPNPKMGDKSMLTAEELFKKTIDRCPEYHSNCYYYLGVINYTFNKEEEAINYFQQFKDFNASDISRFSPDREKRLTDINEILKKREEEQKFLENKVPFDPTLVENVSSNRDEYFPMVSPDNEIIFYTRRVDRTAKGDIVSSIREEFTWSQLISNSDRFDSGEPLKPPFNTGEFDSYGASTMSVDNKEMIICACKNQEVRGQQYKNCDLYVTYYEKTGDKEKDYTWTKLKNLGEAINTPDGWEGQPTLSSDGSTLYYTVNRVTSQNNDIYYSKRMDDGSWSPARPFTEVNTPGKDKSPFFHQDSETFYFVSSVSEERKGLGGTDIFYMRKDEDGSWGKPKNIGYPINTAEDEIGLIVSTNGSRAFFSSQQNGVWNIYSFELYEKARPKAVTIIKGDLTDEEGNPAKDVELEISYQNSDVVEKVRVNGNDGKYAAVIKTDDPQDVMVNIKKEGHAFNSTLITKEELSSNKSINAKDLAVKELKEGEAYTINDILYATASDELSDRAQFILRQFARFLKENEELEILIQGHTDNEGNAAKNLALSDRRAKKVKQYLIQMGVAEERLSAKGYGQTQPKVPNTSETNKAQNRRTDFVIK